MAAICIIDTVMFLVSLIYGKSFNDNVFLGVANNALYDFGEKVCSDLVVLI